MRKSKSIASVLLAALCCLVGLVKVADCRKMSLLRKDMMDKTKRIVREMNYTKSKVETEARTEAFRGRSRRFLAEPAAFNSWAKTARLGGAAMFVGMTRQEMEKIIDSLLAQKITVIEADSELSNYLTDAQFDMELDLMRTVKDVAHSRGLKVVWYYPALEVVTPNGKKVAKTIYKEHPDWVQYGMDGQPNVFYGGTGQVFWVEPNDESAWMSPSSPGYRKYFIDRARKIVATGIDGLWLDVPIYADFGSTKWSDFNPAAVAKFKSDTGYTAPAVENWNDPSFRRWIAWRHEELARFLGDVTTAIRSVDREFPVFAETLPTDYNGATIYGLDGSYLKHIEGLTHVWEVDSMSNNVGMRNAREDDWISFISAYKYTKAASGKKPSWVFTYGIKEDDAELVMAEAIAAGNNPYELMVPEMTTTVGDAYRKRMFGWVGANSPYLFEAKSIAKVAIFYSGASRDFVDKFEGLGMFATWQSGGDSLWWAGAAMDSVYERRYLAEFRGMVKLLVHEHIPFNTVVNLKNTQELVNYETVILPNVEAISDAEADILRQYVQGGGKLIVTGPNPTGYDEYGMTRAEYALADVLIFRKSDTLPSQLYLGLEGRVHFYASRLGKEYFVTNSVSAKQKLMASIKATSTIPLTTNADRRVHFELGQLGNERILQFVNFIGMDGTFSVVSTSFSVSLAVPVGSTVSRVALTSPDLPNSPALATVPFKIDGQTVTFSVALDQYALVVVSLEGTVSPPVSSPIAPPVAPPVPAPVSVPVVAPVPVAPPVPAPVLVPVAPPMPPVSPPVSPPVAPPVPAPVVAPLPVAPPVPAPVLVPVAPPVPVSSLFTFYLINANSDTRVKVLSNGDVIPPGASYSIDAVPSSSVGVGSVQFMYNGNLFQTENAAPFALCGNSGGNFNPCSILSTAGLKTVQAMAYTGTYGSDILIAQDTISFSIGTGSPVPPVSPPVSPPIAPPVSPPVSVSSGVTGFFLINSNTNLIIQEIPVSSQAVVINISGAGSSGLLNVAAQTNGSVGSVKFGYNGNASLQIENKAPWALCGDTNGDYNSCSFLSAGMHTVTVTAYSASGASGEVLNTLTVSFTLI